jgi:hypothetical protein
MSGQATDHHFCCSPWLYLIPAPRNHHAGGLFHDLNSMEGIAEQTQGRRSVGPAALEADSIFDSFRLGRAELTEVEWFGGPV